VGLEPSIGRQRGAEVDARLVSSASEQDVRDERLDETIPSCREAPGDRRRRPQDPGLGVRGDGSWFDGTSRETGKNALKPSEGDEPNREPDSYVQERRADYQVSVGARKSDDANYGVDRSPR